MSAVGWSWLRRLFQNVAIRQRSQRTLPKRKRSTVPLIEPLEAMALLSAGARMVNDPIVNLDRAGHQRLVRHATHPRVSPSSGTSADQAPVTPPAQTVSIGDTLTNFANEPLAPALNLFDPSLGTLLSVTVSHSAIIQSMITSQNLSPSSPTVITATFSGSYQIDGLNQPIIQPTQTLTSQPMPAGVFGSGTDTVVFPTLQLTSSSTSTFTDSSSLAFFTGSSGRSAITLTMTATGVATASAPNGNLLTVTRTSASSMVMVTYTYVPVMLPCPTVAGIGRLGVHHQRTQLIVTFDGPVDATKAENPHNYSVLTPSGTKIPIKSATYNPTTNAVTLIPAEHLNVHRRFRLSVVLPCPNSQPPETVVIPFGGKRSLIGFHNHRGELVSVKNGRINGFDNRRGQFIAVHNGKIERFIHRSAAVHGGALRRAPASFR
jgi:hypothetical protein